MIDVYTIEDNLKYYNIECDVPNELSYYFSEARAELFLQEEPITKDDIDFQDIEADGIIEAIIDALNKLRVEILKNK